MHGYITRDLAEVEDAERRAYAARAELRRLAREGGGETRDAARRDHARLALAAAMALLMGMAFAA